MTSLQSKAEAVKTAVNSTSTCTSATTVILKELLLAGLDDDAAADATSNAKTPKAGARKTKTPTAGRSVTATKTKKGTDGLSEDDKKTLAVHVVNGALKSLAEAAKPQKQPEARKPQERKALRRSNSTPISPLQPRTLNRVATSPTNPATKHQQQAVPSPSTACLATIECLRAAFSYLRSVQEAGKKALPESHLEAGMSRLVSASISLGLHEHAAKDLGILKRRLDFLDKNTKKEKNGPSASDAKRSLADYLDFGNTGLSGVFLDLAVTTQLQVLRIISAHKKPGVVEASVPFLKATYPSSPVSLLLKVARQSEQGKTKAARQLQQFAQLIHTLPPSISSSEDSVATENRLSPSPAAALELHAIGFEYQLQWWALAGHQADVDKELLSKFSRCLAAFGRRVGSPSASSYRQGRDAFERVSTVVHDQGLTPATTSKSPMAAMYQTLGTLAQTARRYDDATCWISKVRDLLRPGQDSAAKSGSVTAQLVAAMAKRQPIPTNDLEPLLQEAVDALTGPLGGDVSEFDELMHNLCSARRSAVGILVEKPDADGRMSGISQKTLGLCSTLVVQFPRFALRWLGKAPNREGDAKNSIRFEQRRHLLTTYTPQVLDSCFAILKSRLDEDSLPWEEVDSVLHNCLALVEAVGDASLPVLKGDSSNSYAVKVSQLYYVFSHIMRRKDDAKAEFRALKRSIETVKDLSAKEKERALLPRKLERFSALCKQGGRLTEARDALKAICTDLVGDGVLAGVAASLNEQPPSLAWTANHKSETLSRTLAAMIKLDEAWNDWTFFLPDLERAAVLEQIIHIALSETAKSSMSTTTSSSLTDALLRIYTIERFPLRRLRAYLQLLAMNVGGDNVQFESFRQQAQTALDACESGQFSDDTSLSRYLAHHRAYFGSLLALASSDSTTSNTELERALSSWRCIIDGSKSTTAIFDSIDDPAFLLRHLESLGQFANFKGEERLRVMSLELCAELSRLLSEDSVRPMLLSHSSLADVYVALGCESKAGMILEKALSQLEETQASDEDCAHALANLRLSSVEHHLACQNFEKAESDLLQAKDAFGKNAAVSESIGLQEKMLLARANMIWSTISMGRGDAHKALGYAKTSTRLLYSTWAKLESRREAEQKTESHQPSSLITGHRGIDSSNTSLMEDSTMSLAPQKSVLQLSDGPELWALACAVFQSIFRLSAVFLHFGMFQETLYYADKAVDIAKNMGSAAYQSEAQSWIGSVWIRANNPEKGLPFLDEAKGFLLSSYQQPSHLVVRLAFGLSDTYGRMKDHDTEKEMLKLAEDTLALLNNSFSVQAEDNLAQGMDKLSLKETANTSRATRSSRTARATATKTTRTAKKPAPAKTKTVAPKNPAAPVEEQFPAFQKLMLLRRTFVLLAKGEWTAASALLEEAKHFSQGSEESLEAQVSSAVCLIGESLEQMILDSVFSVVPDSTISFPSVANAPPTIAGAGNGGVDKACVVASPPARKPRGRPTTKLSKGGDAPGFVQTLQRALDYLTEANSIATVAGNSHLVYRISSLLQSTTIFLSAAATRDLKALPHAGLTTCSTEVARNITWRRERKAMLADMDPSSRQNETIWPAALTTTMTDTANGPSLVTDMNKFQRNYVNIIPATWSVVSISLSDNRQDLCITKLEAGRSPFVIRLPLERSSSRDADSEDFDFERGHAELLEVVRLVNETAHSNRDWSVPGVKTAWWKERQELDERMGELLRTVEQVWLNGFKGIFSQHARRTDLLARFQKTFYGILDKHLPSRRQVGRGQGRRNAGAAKGTAAAEPSKIMLDPRVLDLFIGLGNPDTQEEVHGDDMFETLNDLLYFVVDILQFHGERNAYDEIDFESMVVETVDALRGYHQGVANGSRDEHEEVGTVKHTVLVLDKPLHAFPWESLPCMQGLAISRVPSMACLRRLILEQRRGTEAEEDADGSSTSHGHVISPSNGTYILNPGTDLINTQKTFEKPLSSLLARSGSGSPSTASPSPEEPSWNGIVARAPTEDEFSHALSDSDVLLYFGHGSGSQYIRAKSIRRLEKCRAAALLMGCSSASLADAGQFECHGPVWNYMMAGCPAVVGTLWDVTDKDIDRFAGRLFEEWGLLGAGTFETDKWSERKGAGKTQKMGASGRKQDGRSRAKGKRKGEEADDGYGGDEGINGMGASLVEAVARSRDACRFRYITAGAVCVYGIPVYVGK